MGKRQSCGARSRVTAYCRTASYLTGAAYCELLESLDLVPFQVLNLEKLTCAARYNDLENHHCGESACGQSMNTTEIFS